MDLSEKTELTWLADLIADLREAARAYEPLVVGAMARDLLLHYGLDVRITRATADIDLAFAVRDWDEFNTLSLLLRISLQTGRAIAWFTEVNHPSI